MNPTKISSNYSWLNTEQSDALFGQNICHIPLKLMRLRNARILWLNESAAGFDPNFESAGSSAVKYESHILSSCAYALKADETKADGIFEDDYVKGYADRYGGPGIGLNGGSGRAAIVNGYLVKGIGRTLLVSSLTEESHASGGAYLEESVREAIYSEIVRLEFPHSAVPILAIIDTGIEKIWQTATGPKRERRTLIVRPCFIRPAHFERATAFYSGNPHEGVRDAKRVGQFFSTAVSLFGKDELGAAYERLWVNWAQQLAYGFVHRLPHGSNTVSNICFDGKLLDFGAMSAVPSWAMTATMMNRETIISLFNFVPATIRSLSYFFGRHLDFRFNSEKVIESFADNARLEFRRTLVSETLNLLGVQPDVSVASAKEADFDKLRKAIVTLINHFQHERIDMLEATAEPKLKWDVDKIWSKNVPNHLRDIEAIVKSLIPIEQQEIAANQCRLLATTRTNLFREEAKATIYNAVELGSTSPATDRALIGRFISEQIAQGRRDNKFLIAMASPTGFINGSAPSPTTRQTEREKREFNMKVELPQTINPNSLVT
jgi:hypothetical protein